MKAIDFMRWTLALALPLAASTGNAAISLPLYNAPGVGAPSLPLFTDSNETVKFQKLGSGANTYWKLTGSGDKTVFSTLNSTGSAINNYNLGDDKVKYEANFNAAGQLITSIGSKSLSNFLEIKGSLPAGSHGSTTWTPKSEQLLLKADLLDANPSNHSPDNIGTWGGIAIGFGTKFTGGWAPSVLGLTGGSKGESLWLTGLSSDFRKLVNALDTNADNGNLSSLFNSREDVTIKNVTSISSVPVPGAVWLFLTGMMAVLGLHRKKGSNTLNL